MSRIAVFGAAGRTGRLIVGEALLAGHDVTAAVRAPDAHPPADASAVGRLSVVPADVRDRASVETTITGHDAVVCAIGPKGRRSGHLYSTGARCLLAAMRSTGVPRILAITSAGVRADDPHFGFLYAHLLRHVMEEVYRDMRLMESIIRDGGVDWTFVRPTRLLDDAPTGTYRIEDGLTPRRGRTITRTDLARFVVADLRAHRWSRAAPTLAE